MTANLPVNNVSLIKAGFNRERREKKEMLIVDGKLLIVFELNAQLTINN